MEVKLVIETPKSRSGDSRAVTFFMDGTGCWNCALCNNSMPRELVEHHVRTHIPGEAQGQPAQRSPAPPEIVNHPDTPTDVMIRCTQEIEERKIVKVLVIQFSEDRLYFSSNMLPLELVGAIHHSFPRILSILDEGMGEAKKL